MAVQSVRIVNMTSTEIFKIQVNNIFDSMRHRTNTPDSDITFYPTQMGGVLGQRDIIDNKNIMRRLEVAE